MLVSDNAARDTLMAGPRRDKKHCTDFVCLVAFAVAIVALVVVAGIGYHEGNPEALQQFVTGSDFDGNRCGEDDAVKDFKFTYYTLKLGETIPSSAEELRTLLLPVCTDQCPPSNVYDSSAVVSRPDSRCSSNAVGEGLCTNFPAGTVIRVANYCLSSYAFDIGVNMGAWVEDIKQAGVIMACSPLIALAFGFTFLFVIYHCGSLIIWVAMISITVMPAVAGAVIFANAQAQASGSPSGHDDIPGVDSLSPETQKDIAYVLFVAAGILLITMLCLCRTVNSVAQVLKNSSDFLTDVPSQMLQPIFFGGLQLIVLAILLVVGVQVASINADAPPSDECRSLVAAGSPFCVRWTGTSQVYAVLFVAIMAFWLVSFLMAVSHYGTSFAVGEWYFATPNEDGRRHPLGNVLGCCDFRLTIRGICSGLGNHAGSLATGSLIVGICKIIRVSLGWVKATNHANPNVCTKILVCITGCIVSCIARFIEFVSEHAYVEVALTGHGFCASAMRAMTMIVEHPGLFTLVSRVAVAMEVLGMCVVSGCTMLVVAVLLNWFPPDGLSSPTTPLVAAAIVGLVIGEVTMHPLIVAARASLHCFVLDEEQSKEHGVPTARHAPHKIATFAQEGRNSVGPVVLG